jgi:xanthine dehydrogenase/oxidase
MDGTVSFYLNGKAIEIADATPDLLLIDYLRSPGVGLAGPKKPCGQGGCGGCTVILSDWDGGQVRHRAINSCLRPVCALGGQVITTVEGTSAVRRPAPQFLRHAPGGTRAVAPPQAALVMPGVQDGDAGAPDAGAHLAPVHALTAPGPHVDDHEHDHDSMNPVAHRLALNNGSQCGYCSVGFVMNMSEFIVNHPLATQKEIEACFDGNLCRCTGYRAILTGMKTFASDWTADDEAARMPCQEYHVCKPGDPAGVRIPFPAAARTAPLPVNLVRAERQWRTPTTLDELAGLMHAQRGAGLRLVHGNTSFGIYQHEFFAAQQLVDIRLLAALHEPVRIEGDYLRVAAGTSYNALIDLLDEYTSTQGTGTTGLDAASFMARRTAGRIVRNAATLAGNTMLVLSHIATAGVAPFPSDLMTVLCAIDARAAYLRLGSDGRFVACEASADELIDLATEGPAWLASIVLQAWLLPLAAPGSVALAQKVALRDVNSHSIVNAATVLALSADLTVTRASLVFGGIAPYPWHARQTEALLANRALLLADMPVLVQALEQEVRAELARWATRMAAVPADGFDDAYRVQLAGSFLYKAIVHAFEARGAALPPGVASAGAVTWGNWPVSSGRQHFSTQNFKKPVAQPYIKSSAMDQASGQVHYTQELAVPPRTLNGAFVLSLRALAHFDFMVPGSTAPASVTQLCGYLRGYAASFVELITAHTVEAIPHGVNLQGMGLDQPLFATDSVHYAGQSIALVLATTEQEAIRIAEHISTACIGYRPISWPARWQAPVLGLDHAIGMNSIYPDAPEPGGWMAHIWKITRPGSRFDWVSTKAPLDRAIVERTIDLDGAPCTVVENTQSNGGQAHFYMETQACVAEPLDGDRMLVHPSSQSPKAMHQTVAMALGVHYHQIDVQVAPVGGGFGGKTEASRFVAGPAAVAARAVGRPVRIAVPRDQDTSLIGKRHALYGQYQIAIDTGALRSEDRGRMRGMHTRMWADGGAFYDCSFVVTNCIQLRADNAYKVANFENQIDVCRTNTAPSTAFRAFGDVQGKNIVENAVDDAAFAVGMTAEAVREMNLYERGDVTPFGQALSYCYMKQVWVHLKEVAGYEAKRAGVDAFNTDNRWRKRGLAMIPVKYGSGYNLQQLEQAGAMVAINSADGSLVIHQGGVEMGQGLLTQVLQVAAYVMNVPMELIHVEGPRTSVIPNATGTGASTGTPYSCEAVRQTCQVLRSRLMEFGYQMRNDHGDAWCANNGIDFWNYPEGWAAIAQGPEQQGKEQLVWQLLVAQAYINRIDLLASFTAQIAGGGLPVPSMTFKPQALQPDLPGIERKKDTVLGGGVDSFVGFTYSAACAVVELDVLTGEVKILSADIMYDAGWSLNPAIDIGQVEGAFVQGIGYLLTEKLVFQEEGDEQGRLNSVNTWGYKVPAMSTIPLEMNVYLFPRDLASVQGIPDNPNDIFSAKEIGEPPLVLANSVFFALKAAVRASRLERGLPGLFRFDAPATVQEVRRACAIEASHLST